MNDEPHEFASVDGLITATDQATIRLKDDGLFRGDGAFEVCRVYGGTPFALTDHIDRLDRSCASISLSFDRAALSREIDALIAEAEPLDGCLRVIITRGGRRIVTTEPNPYSGDPQRLATITYAPSIILNGVKSLSYAANMHASRLAIERGADEALFVRPDGVVLELPTATIFWVGGDGVLRTPSLADGVLASITRDRLLKALAVTEGTWHVDDLLGASEAFIASTGREVEPVSAIDETAFLDVPGPRTLEAQEAFAATLERELALSSFQPEEA